MHPQLASLLQGEFAPRRGLANGHLQTVAGNFWPRPRLMLQATAETVVVDPADGSRVLCHCHWQADRANCLTLLLLHGLEGSSESRYIQGITRRAWAAGANVIRMNMRNCGGTEDLAPTLYHSGLSGDVAAVIEHFSAQYQLGKIALVGYSMGGNMVLKLAGEWGNRAPLAAVAAVSPATDLAPSAKALHQPLNRLYEVYFLHRLMQRLNRKAMLYPSIYEMKMFGSVRSIHQFDERIMATYCGFEGAEDYYYRASAARVIDRIQVPTLILQAADDPFIRVLPETRTACLANPNITYVETRHGGHCAFLGAGTGEAIHWAEENLVRYLLVVTGAASGS